MKNIFPRIFFCFLNVKIRAWARVGARDCLGLVLEERFEFGLDLGKN